MIHFSVSGGFGDQYAELCARLASGSEEFQAILANRLRVAVLLFSNDVHRLRLTIVKRFALHTFLRTLSTTFFSPALSKWIVSLLPSTTITLPLPNCW